MRDRTGPDSEGVGRRHGVRQDPLQEDNQAVDRRVVGRLRLPRRLSSTSPLHLSKVMLNIDVDIRYPHLELMIMFPYEYDTHKTTCSMIALEHRSIVAQIILIKSNRDAHTKHDAVLNLVQLILTVDIDTDVTMYMYTFT